MFGGVWLAVLDRGAVVGCRQDSLGRLASKHVFGRLGRVAGGRELGAIRVVARQWVGILLRAGVLVVVVVVVVIVVIFVVIVVVMVVVMVGSVGVVGVVRRVRRVGGMRGRGGRVVVGRKGCLGWRQLRLWRREGILASHGHGGERRWWWRRRRRRTARLGFSRSGRGWCRCLRVVVVYGLRLLTCLWETE